MIGSAQFGKSCGDRTRLTLLNLGFSRWISAQNSRAPSFVKDFVPTAVCPKSGKSLGLHFPSSSSCDVHTATNDLTLFPCIPLPHDLVDKVC